MQNKETTTPKIQREDVEYVCDECKRGYYTQKGLDRHVTRNHEQCVIGLNRHTGGERRTVSGSTNR